MVTKKEKDEIYYRIKHGLSGKPGAWEEMKRCFYADGYDSETIGEEVDSFFYHWRLGDFDNEEVVVVEEE